MVIVFKTGVYVAFTKNLFLDQESTEKELITLTKEVGLILTLFVSVKVYLKKIGGWAKASTNSFLSTGRALHAWVDLAGTRYLGLGTTWKYYVLEGQVYSDITPIRATTTNGIVFAATDGSSTITATDDDHGAVVDDFVTISGAATLGGLITANVLNQEYQITAVTTDTYTFTAKDTDGDTVTANASDSGNGGSGVDGLIKLMWV